MNYTLAQSSEFGTGKAGTHLNIFQLAQLMLIIWRRHIHPMTRSC